MVYICILTHPMLPHGSALDFSLIKECRARDEKSRRSSEAYHGGESQLPDAGWQYVTENSLPVLGWKCGVDHSNNCTPPLMQDTAFKRAKEEHVERCRWLGKQKKTSLRTKTFLASS